MNLEIYRHLWGVDEPLPSVIPKIKALGYAGVETGLGGSDRKEVFRELLAENELKYIAMIFSAGASVKEHLESFRQQVGEAQSLGAVSVTSHSGRDAFSREESRQFFAEALEIEKAAGIQVAHETHRGRILFNPWITRFILDELPLVKLCSDLSHWVCVCERLLGGEEEIVRQAASHTFHLHARVGFEQGPQVPDPRAPEYARYLEAHERWWDLVWESQRQRGFQISTLTPEFGPPGYMHTLPYTGVPVANLWDICEWQARRQKERFAAAAGTA